MAEQPVALAILTSFPKTGGMHKRIAIDMDEVLADTLTHHLAIYSAEHGDSLSAADLDGRKIYEAVDEVRRGNVRSGFQQHGATGGQDRYTSVAKFGGRLYIAAGWRGLLCFDGATIVAVKTGLGIHLPCHMHDMRENVLWCFGN